MINNWEQSNDIHYKHVRDGDLAVITIEQNLNNPALMCESGAISAQIEQQDDSWVFTFGLADIPTFEGISTYIYIQDGTDIYRLITKSKKRLKNFNNIKCVWYDQNMVYYFRNTASKRGRLTFHRKERLYFESPEYGKMQRKAHKKYKDIVEDQVLIYEKEAMRFEESGSKLFEKIWESPNVYYVISSISPQFEQLNELYPGKIITPESDQFLKLIHTAKYYIGTELPMHLIGLRSPYKSLRTEIMNSEKHKFIFLQHGVTQSLSLAGPERAIFRNNFTYSPYKVVVSSEMEAEHFVEVGNYQPEDLWNIGLATLDNKKKKLFAKKISVMLTWCPWDQMQDSIEDTSYYQAVLSIFNAIENKRNLQIILHPKVKEQIDSSNPLFEYLCDTSIDEALSNTKILITDYSSVVFDAFYRGTNVIFWWNQKEACLEQYNNTLLITEENAFGDIIYDNSQLNTVVKNNNKRKQKQQYIENYRQFVEHFDNQNTERLIAKLREEQIID